MFRLALALAAASLALGAAAPLDAAKANRTFFGIDMAGVTADEAAIPWRECINAKGETTYWFEGEIDRGRLRVREDGALCFSYASRNYEDEACFAAFAEPRGQYRFVSDGGGSVFVTKRFTRGVRSCPTSAPTS